LYSIKFSGGKAVVKRFDLFLDGEGFDGDWKNSCSYVLDKRKMFVEIMTEKKIARWFGIRELRFFDLFMETLSMELYEGCDKSLDYLILRYDSLAILPDVPSTSYKEINAVRLGCKPRRSKTFDAFERSIVLVEKLVDDFRTSSSVLKNVFEDATKWFTKAYWQQMKSVNNSGQFYQIGKERFRGVVASGAIGCCRLGLRKRDVYIELYSNYGDAHSVLVVYLGSSHNVVVISTSNIKFIGLRFDGELDYDAVRIGGSYVDVRSFIVASQVFDKRRFVDLFGNPVTEQFLSGRYVKDFGLLFRAINSGENIAIAVGSEWFKNCYRSIGVLYVGNHMYAKFEEPSFFNGWWIWISSIWNSLRCGIYIVKDYESCVVSYVKWYNSSSLDQLCMCVW